MSCRTQYALNANQSDAAPYTNNRRDGWTYDADGRVTASADTSTSSTRTWTYDVAGDQVSVAETISGATTTNTLAYDGDGYLLYESVVRSGSTTTDYLIRSRVLGTVLTKLDAAGAKDMTYVPANGLVMPLQQKDYLGNAIMSWVHRDALGVQEDGKAYDPFGNLIYNVQPPTSGSPPNVPFYGATYGGASWSTFSNANNLSNGCMSASGVPADCNGTIGGMTFGLWSNLPGVYIDMEVGMSRYVSNVTERFNSVYNRAPGAAPPTLHESAHSRGALDATGGLAVGTDGTLADEGDVDLENNIVNIYGGAQFASASFGAGLGLGSTIGGSPHNTLTVEHFGPKQESWIRYELQKILNPKCTKAYNAEDLKGPSQIISDRGVVIRPAEDLRRPAADLHLGERTRKYALANVFTAQAGTVFGTDGSLQIYLNSKAFFGPSWDGEFESLGDVLKHEFIHEYISEWPSPWRPTSHDLSGYPGYNRIMEGCK